MADGFDILESTRIAARRKGLIDGLSLALKFVEDATPDDEGLAEIQENLEEWIKAIKR